MAINGSPVEPYPSEDWRTLPAGTTVDVKDGSGTERTLLLADYY